MRRALTALLALLVPAAAHACAACGAGTGGNRAAFLGTTALLSLLPLAMMGGGFWWLARQSRGRLAAEFEERDPLAGPGSWRAAPDEVAPGGTRAMGDALAAPDSGRKG